MANQTGKRLASAASSSRLFGAVMEKFKLTNDKQLSEKAGIARSRICNIRAGKEGISERNLLQIAAATGWSIKKIYELLEEDKNAKA